MRVKFRDLLRVLLRAHAVFAIIACILSAIFILPYRGATDRAHESARIKLGLGSTYQVTKIMHYTKNVDWYHHAGRTYVTYTERSGVSNEFSTDVDLGDEIKQITREQNAFYVITILVLAYIAMNAIIIAAYVDCVKEQKYAHRRQRPVRH